MRRTTWTPKKKTRRNWQTLEYKKYRILEKREREKERKRESVYMFTLLFTNKSYSTTSKKDQNLKSKYLEKR